MWVTSYNNVICTKWVGLSFVRLHEYFIEKMWVTSYNNVICTTWVGLSFVRLHEYFIEKMWVTSYNNVICTKWVGLSFVRLHEYFIEKMWVTSYNNVICTTWVGLSFVRLHEYFIEKMWMTSYNGISPRLASNAFLAMPLRWCLLLIYSDLIRNGWYQSEQGCYLEQRFMMTLWYENSFRVTVPLWGCTPVDSSQKGPATRSFNVSSVVSLYELLNKQSRNRLFEAPHSSCDVTEMFSILLMMAHIWGPRITLNAKIDKTNLSLQIAGQLTEIFQHNLGLARNASLKFGWQRNWISMKPDYQMNSPYKGPVIQTMFQRHHVIINVSCRYRRDFHRK